MVKREKNNRGKQREREREREREEEEEDIREKRMDRSWSENSGWQGLKIEIYQQQIGDEF